MSQTTSGADLQELDVRGMRKPDKHPTIFARYAALPVGAAFVLVNDHDPKHLRDEFEADHGGGYRWEYLTREPRNWRIRITKLAAAPLPRLLADTTALATGSDAGGVRWTLPATQRDLDANVIALPPGGTIGEHTGPDVDVLVHVLAGGGWMSTERDAVDLAPGALVWLPRRSRRGFAAGPDGLRYLTVHQRRQALVLEIACPGGPR
ncbi:MAG: DUF2249 domain-containing protein [Pseudonocardia sp.]